MELKLLLKIVSSNIKFITIASLLICIVAVVAAVKTPSSYKAAASLFVKREVSSNNYNYFTYEGFYGIQTAEKYTDSVIGLLRSPDLRHIALTSLNRDAGSQSVSRLEKRITVKRAGPQVVNLTLRGSDKEDVKVLWLSLADSVLEKSQELNKNGDSKLSIEIVANEPIVSEVRVPVWIAGLVGLLSGLLGSICILVFRSYTKE